VAADEGWSLGGLPVGEVGEVGDIGPIEWGGHPGSSAPLFEPPKSTPLDDGRTGGVVPRPVLWAMRYHRGTHLPGEDDTVTEDRLGEGDSSVYVTGDGSLQCMIARLVGRSPDGSVYCLVGITDVGVYERYAAGDDPIDGIFAEAWDFLFCAVYEADDGPSNVADLGRYRKFRRVPVEYLPPTPFAEFDDQLT
jgi:hypothetical protein